MNKLILKLNQMHVIRNRPLNPQPSGIVEFNQPMVCFTVAFGLERQAATHRFTALTWGSRIENKTYILCPVAIEMMQSESDQKSAFEQLADYYSDLGECKDFRYMENGCNIDPREDFPLKAKKRN